MRRRIHSNDQAFFFQMLDGVAFLSEVSGFELWSEAAVCLSGLYLRSIMEKARVVSWCWGP